MSDKKEDDGWDNLDINKFVTGKPIKKMGRPTKAEAAERKAKEEAKAKRLRVGKCCSTCDFAIKAGNASRIFCGFPHTTNNLPEEFYNKHTTFDRKTEIALSYGKRKVYDSCVCDNWRSAPTDKLVKIAIWVGHNNVDNVFE